MNMNIEYGTPQGWQCPVCKRVYSPSISMCLCCSHETYATISTQKSVKQVCDEKENTDGKKNCSLKEVPNNSFNALNDYCEEHHLASVDEDVWADAKKALDKENRMKELIDKLEEEQTGENI